MSGYLYVTVSVCGSVCLCVRMSLCVSLFAYVSLCLCVLLSSSTVSVSVCGCVCVSVYACLCACLCACKPLWLCVLLSSSSSCPQLPGLRETIASFACVRQVVARDPAVTILRVKNRLSRRARTRDVPCYDDCHDLGFRSCLFCMSFRI